MRIFWWQGGLHIEPENDADFHALRLLYSAKRGWPESLSGDGQEFSVGDDQDSAPSGGSPVHSLDNFTVG